MTPWTVACQAPLSLEFSRQEYWSGLPFPSPGDLPNLGIEPGSPELQADSSLPEPPGKPLSVCKPSFPQVRCPNDAMARPVFPSHDVTSSYLNPSRPGSDFTSPTCAPSVLSSSSLRISHSPALHYSLIASHCLSLSPSQL